MTPNRTRPRRGIALMMAVVYTTLVLSIWSLANRQTGAMLRLREAHAARIGERSEEDAGADAFDPRLAALAGGLVLMTRPGFPADPDPDPPTALPRYTCRVPVDADPGPFASPQTYILEFSRDAPSGSWTASSFEEGHWQGLASGPDPWRAATSRGLDLLGMGGLPDAPPGDPRTALGLRIDANPDPDQVDEQPIVVEFLRIDAETWAVAAATRAEWDALGGPRREAIGLGLDAIGPRGPPFDPADPGPPYRYRADPAPFALEFSGAGPGEWIVSAFSEAEWDALQKQPSWGELPPLPE